MKYIVCQVRKNGEPWLEVPFVFPDMLVHSMVFAQMRALLQNQYGISSDDKVDVVAVSAGALSSMDLSTSCYGKSDTLGITSRSEVDDQLLRMADYGACNNPQPVVKKPPRVTALKRVCPTCEALPGQPCHNLKSKLPLVGSHPNR